MTAACSHRVVVSVTGLALVQLLHCVYVGITRCCLLGRWCLVLLFAGSVVFVLLFAGSEVHGVERLAVPGVCGPL